MKETEGGVAVRDIGKRSILRRMVLFAGVVTTFFYLLVVAAMPKYTTPSKPEEIASADLSTGYICLAASNVEVYSGRLYTDADFAAGTVSAGDSDAKFETCRVVLPLKAGVTYGITGQTATYAQRVYVNGELLHEIGCVSDRAAEFTPKTDFYTVYFTPQSDETEIIVQHAWFNHTSGAFQKLYLAEQQVITRTNRAQALCDGLVVGTLLAMTVFFLGMFLFAPANRGMLWFSLSCLCATANYLIYESKQIMTFFPRLNWYVGHKIELLTNIYYFVFIVLFALFVLKLRPGKRLTAFACAVIGILTLFYLLAPSTLYTRYTVLIGAVMLLLELITAVCLLRQSIRAGNTKQPDLLFVSLSPLLTALVYLIEDATYFSHIFYLRAYLMILLAFCNALVLTIGHARTERSLSEAQRRELAIAEENAMLEKMNRLRGDFMRNFAHEMKTPLTVMSGYAQLTERQIRKNAVNEETAANLDTIAREAGRLSDMVTQLLDVTYHGAEGRNSVFAPGELLEDAAAVCRPILQKNQNRLEIVCRTERSITANKESLLQVLINLCINSNKHTTGGLVTIRADDAKDGAAAFTVKDTGSGISAEDLPHIFERGYSSDGGNGLGLTICWDIIEAAGGSIAVEQTDSNGTTIRFTVPAGKEEQA